MSNLQQHILEKLETYKDLFDNAHDLIHILEPEGKIIYANSAWRKILGYTEDEIQGKSIYLFVQQDDRDRFKVYRENVLNGTIQESEITVGLTMKNGNIIYVEGVVSSKIVEGKPLYTRGIFRDVTRRLENETQLKSLNEQLREREAGLEQLLFYAPDAIVVIDSKSIIRYWNPKAEQIFGWSYNEVLGEPLTQVIIPAQYREAHIAGMKRYLTTGEAHVLNKTIEIISLNKRGQEFYVALTISSTYQNGEMAFIAFIRDIEEQRRSAQELERKKTQLELSNQQLEQFAHIASHDMKEPIRKILMFTDKLKSEMAQGLSGNSMNYIGKIEKAASRLAEMVDGVLSNSSLKAEKLVIEKVDLNEVIKNIETDLELRIQQKNAVIKNSGLPTIEGSSFLLYQLFYNLISNSLKFSKHDIITVIELSCNRILQPQLKSNDLHPDFSYFEIVLKDNGIGFAQEYSESIFKTFSRLHPKEKYEGTGIGLSLCKSIVEKHHGYITAFGRENHGATFSILLPETQA